MKQRWESFHQKGSSREVSMGRCRHTSYPWEDVHIFHVNMRQFPWEDVFTQVIHGNLYTHNLSMGRRTHFLWDYGSVFIGRCIHTIYPWHYVSTLLLHYTTSTPLTALCVSFHPMIHTTTFSM